MNVHYRYKRQRNTVLQYLIDLNDNMHWNRCKEKNDVKGRSKVWIPDVTSTSTGKISSSWEGAGWLALIRINAV